MWHFQNVLTHPTIYPLLNTCMQHSQNLPFISRINPTFPHIFVTFPESTPPSQNIPTYSTTIYACDTLIIYSSLPEYIHLLYNTTLSEYIPPSYKIPPLKHVYATLQEFIPPSQNIPCFLQQYMRPSQNLPLSLRIYPPFLQLYVTLPECTPPRIYLSFLQLYAMLTESIPLSGNIPPFIQLYVMLP